MPQGDVIMLRNVIHVDRGLNPTAVQILLLSRACFLDRKFIFGSLTYLYSVDCLSHVAASSNSVNTRIARLPQTVL